MRSRTSRLDRFAGNWILSASTMGCPFCVCSAATISSFDEVTACRNARTENYVHCVRCKTYSTQYRENYKTAIHDDRLMTIGTHIHSINYTPAMCAIIDVRICLRREQGTNNGPIHTHTHHVPIAYIVCHSFRLYCASIVVRSSVLFPCRNSLIFFLAFFISFFRTLCRT